MILGLKQAAATLNDADVPAEPVTTTTVVSRGNSSGPIQIKPARHGISKMGQCIV